MSACSVRVNGQGNNSYEGEYTHADVDVNEFHNIQFYLLAFLIAMTVRLFSNSEDIITDHKYLYINL